jgi:DNA invertase Pin-like site-specific DNA recombinase
MHKFISYRRVSTSEQGRSGLGLEAQAAAIEQFVASRGGQVLQDFVEVETGKGSNALERRPKLREAIAEAKRRRATLVVSKLDRLSRNVHFISGVMESKVNFVAAETPTADPFMLHIYAAVAQHERAHIAGRISAALQAKKRAALADGKLNPLGNAASLQPHNEERKKTAQAFAERLSTTLQAYQAASMPQRAMVKELNRQGIKTARGAAWSLMQLQRVLARLPRPRPDAISRGGV